MSTKTVLTAPSLAVATADEALYRVNRWLGRAVGMAVHATQAEFDAVSYYWHLPVELAFAATGPLGVVGDIYLHAVTGDFAGPLDAAELIRRAESLAAANGIADGVEDAALV